MLSVLCNDDFPDPSILITEEYLYLFGTQSEACPNIQCRRARSWEGPWENLEGVIQGTTAREHWAPDVPILVGSEYRLYYTIDPFVLSHEGTEWLFFGSMHEPIRCQALAPDGRRFAPGSQPREVLSPGSGQYDKLIEGFFLKYHTGLNQWFAFVSGNNTWDKDDYGVTCYSADTPFGPFTRVGTVVEPSEKLWAPGQCSIAEKDGIWYFVCHAVLPHDPKTPAGNLKRVPCAARLTFKDGAPLLELLT